MNRHVLWFAILLTLTSMGCGANHNRTGWKFLPGMYDAVAYDAHDANEVTRDGKTLLLPPEGTVPVGFEPFVYGPGEEESLAAGREMFNPFESNKETLARGEAVYEIYCMICHDSRGEGNGPIIGRFPNPPNLLAPRALGLPDGQIFHILTLGQGVMPSYRSQVNADDRWKAILYLRQLQEASKTNDPDSQAKESQTANEQNLDKKDGAS